jgi:hypothetical protein
MLKPLYFQISPIGWLSDEPERFMQMVHDDVKSYIAIPGGGNNATANGIYDYRGTLTHSLCTFLKPPNSTYPGPLVISIVTHAADEDGQFQDQRGGEIWTAEKLCSALVPCLRLFKGNLFWVDLDRLV